MSAAECPMLCSNVCLRIQAAGRDINGCGGRAFGSDQQATEPTNGGQL